MNDMSDIENIHQLKEIPFNEWTPEALKELIATCNTEIYEWERIKAEAYKHL